MTRVAIFPVPTDQGEMSFCAVAGDKHSRGATAGEALDALTSQLPADEAGMLIIVQSRRPDRYFTAAQQRRLTELIERRRTARSQGSDVSAEELAELKTLIEAELNASADRAAALADELGR